MLIAGLKIGLVILPACAPLDRDWCSVLHAYRLGVATGGVRHGEQVRSRFFVSVLGNLGTIGFRQAERSWLVRLKQITINMLTLYFLTTAKQTPCPLVANAKCERTNVRTADIPAKRITCRRQTPVAVAGRHSLLLSWYSIPSPLFRCVRRISTLW